MVDSFNLESGDRTAGWRSTPHPAISNLQPDLEHQSPVTNASALATYRGYIPRLEFRCLKWVKLLVFCMFKPPATGSEAAPTCIDQLATVYLSRISRAWLGPEPRSRLFLACAALLIALAASANIHVRDAQLQTWQSGDPSTLIYDTPTFSTADAPYFLRHAVSIQRGQPLASFDAGRSYPYNLTAASESSAGVQLRIRPLLSVILAGLATGDDPRYTCRRQSRACHYARADCCSDLHLLRGCRGTGHRVRSPVLAAA